MELLVNKHNTHSSVMLDRVSNSSRLKMVRCEKRITSKSGRSNWLTLKYSYHLLPLYTLKKSVVKQFCMECNLMSKFCSQKFE